MSLYPWIVVAHVFAAFIGFGAHGVSAFSIFQAKREKDRARLATILEFSDSSLLIAGVGLLVAIILGIVAAIAGGHFSHFWPWASIIVIVVVFGVMTPIGANPLSAVRQSLGQPSRLDKKGAGPPPPADDATVAAAQARLQPELLATVGIGAIAILVWLMELKPF